MASAALLRHVSDSAPDADLLRRFVAGRDPDAFAELVRRHGPVVYRVCRRLLGPSSADDAFQATFLILATRPESVRKAGSVGCWLVGVAGRVARQMRKRERRHLASRERQRPEDAPPVADAPGSPELVEQFRVLDEELTRLPDRLRGPVVVCLLHGRTQEQAVAELGGSVRTIRRRLEEAKRLLRLRLERRGVVPVVAAGLAAGVGEATAAVPADLPGRTVSTVFDFLAGGAAVSAPAAVIAKGVAMGTLAGRVKLAMVSAAVGLTALGVGVADDGGGKPTPGTPPTGGLRPLANLRPGVMTPPPAVAGPTTLPQGKAVDTGAAFLMTPSEKFGPIWFTVGKIAVVGPTPASVRAVGNEAAFQRKEVSERWLGKESPEPQHTIVIGWKPDGPPGGVSELSFSGGRLDKAAVRLRGPLQTSLEDQLAREMTHVVLAEHIGRPLPRWAADGASRLAESATSQAEHDGYCRAMLRDGTAFRLSWLFQFNQDTKNQRHVVAEEHSVTRFLLTRKAALKNPVMDDIPYLAELSRNQDRPEAAFLAFAQLGAEGDWDKAAKAIYGFDDVAALERAWIGWLNTPESRLAKGAEPRRPVMTFQRNMPESWYIPAVKVP